MEHTRLNLAQLAAFLGLLALSACSRSHGTTPLDLRCQEQRLCYAVDAIGCCVGTTTAVSVCDECPSGMSEYRECRSTGCEDPCGGQGTDEAPGGAGSGSDRAGGGKAVPIAPPPACRADLGGGCCGDYVAYNECGRCPAGSIEEPRCNGDSLRPSDPVPMPLAEPCYETHGAGCCGGPVDSNACGFCAPGTVPRSECLDFYDSASTDDADSAGFVPPSGGEGDGAPAQWPGDAGQAARPAPSPEDAGIDLIAPPRDAGPSDADRAPPRHDAGGPPLPTDAGAEDPPSGCFTDLGRFGLGCCGEAVIPTACGFCPAGSIPAFECTFFGAECPVRTE